MIKNLTPYPVTVAGITFHPEGIVPRLSQKSQFVRYYENIPLVKLEFGGVVDLPEEQEDTLLIVSAMVRQALPDRKDLASPGDFIRDENGIVTGCGNLVIN